MGKKRRIGLSQRTDPGSLMLERISGHRWRALAGIRDLRIQNREGLRYVTGRLPDGSLVLISPPPATSSSPNTSITASSPPSRDISEPKYFNNGFVPPGATHEPFIPDREISEWRVSDRVLKLKNGSIVGFKSADAGSTKYRGAEKDWIHFDEEHSKHIYEESVIRIGGRPLRVFGTATLLPPEGQVGGVTWIFTDIIKPWEMGKLPNVGIFGASIYDNPHLDQREIGRLESIYPEGSVQRRIRLGGEWLPGLSGARAYPSFDRRVHVKPQPPITQRMPLAWYWDFNVEPMVSGIGQRHMKLFRVYRTFRLP